MTILTGQVPALVVIDRGDRGHGASTAKAPISGMRRGLTPLLARLLNRRSAIEPEIDHMKMDGRLARCRACGHNTRKILAHIRGLWFLLLHLIAAMI